MILIAFFQKNKNPSLNNFHQNKKMFLITLYEDTYHDAHDDAVKGTTQRKDTDDSFLKTNPYNFSPEQIKWIDKILWERYRDGYKLGEYEKIRQDTEAETQTETQDINYKDFIFTPKIKTKNLAYEPKNLLKRTTQYDHR